MSRSLKTLNMSKFPVIENFFLMRPAGQVQSVIPTVLFLMYGDNVESMYSGFLHEFDATLFVLGESSLMH